MVFDLGRRGEPSIFKQRKINSGRPQAARTPRTTEGISNLVTEDPIISVENIARGSNVSVSSTHPI